MVVTRLGVPVGAGRLFSGATMLRQTAIVLALVMSVKVVQAGTNVVLGVDFVNCDLGIVFCFVIDQTLGCQFSTTSAAQTVFCPVPEEYNSRVQDSSVSTCGVIGSNNMTYNSAFSLYSLDGINELGYLMLSALLLDDNDVVVTVTALVQRGLDLMAGEPLVMAEQGGVIAICTLEGGHFCSISTSHELQCSRVGLVEGGDWNMGMETVLDGLLPEDVPPAFTSDIATIECTNDQICAVTNNGSLGCWYYGNPLGYEANASTSYTQLPTDFVDVPVKEVAFYGQGTLCVITGIRRSLKCYDTNSTIIPIIDMQDISSVSLGEDGICAITANNRLYCWERIVDFDWSDEEEWNPLAVPDEFSERVAFVTIVETWADFFYVCQQKTSDGTLQCFAIQRLVKGLGLNKPDPRIPEALTGKRKVEEVSVFGGFICVTTMPNRAVQCFYIDGQELVTPDDIPGSMRIQVGAGVGKCDDYSTAASISDDGTLDCWTYCRLFDSSIDAVTTVPTPIPWMLPGWQDEQVTDVSVAGNFQCALTTEKELLCFNIAGFNETVQADLAELPSSLEGKAVASFALCDAVLPRGCVAVCVVDTNHSLTCSMMGICSSYAPFDIPQHALHDVAKVSCNRFNVCIVFTNKNGLECYGRGNWNVTVPQDLQTSSVTSFSMGDKYICAVTGYRRLYCWGEILMYDVAIPEAYRENVYAVSVSIPPEIEPVVCTVSMDHELACWRLRKIPQNDTIASAYRAVEYDIRSSEDTGDDKLDNSSTNTTGSSSTNTIDSNITNTTSNNGDDSGSSVGLVIGLAVGVTSGVMAGAALLTVVWYRRRNKTCTMHANAMTNGDHQTTKVGEFQKVPFASTEMPQHVSKGPPLSSIYCANGPYLHESLESIATTVDGVSCAGPKANGVPNDASAKAADRTWLIDVGEVLVCTNDDDGSKVVLGKGAQGKVFLGEWQGRAVAIKQVIHAEEREDGIRRMLQELAVMKRCQHNNVVQLLGAAFHQDSILLVMEYMEGGDLFHAIRRDPDPYKWSHRGSSIALQVGRGLCYLHSQRIIHCDIKSLNVLLAGDGTAKIADMGMAKWMLKELVTRGNQMGTWAYAAPELVTNSRISQSVDVYSLGVMMWEMVTGEQPQRGGIYLPRVPDQCPQHVQNIIKACLATTPQGRPTAQQLVDMLSTEE